MMPDEALRLHVIREADRGVLQLERIEVAQTAERAQVGDLQPAILKTQQLAASQGLKGSVDVHRRERRGVRDVRLRQGKGTAVGRDEPERVEAREDLAQDV